MRKACRTAGRVARGGVTAIAVGAAAFLVVPQLLGWQLITLVSGSMAPTYTTDSALLVKPVDADDVREGDVIVFLTEADRPMVAHRVVAIESTAGGTAFVTKGDANEDPDHDPVPASEVRGRVVAGVPYLGIFVRVVHHPVGFVLLLVLPALALIAEEIVSIRRERASVGARRRSHQEVLT